MAKRKTYREVIKEYRETEDIVPRERRIMEIELTNEKYRSCNVCRRHKGPKRELRLGCNNQSVSMCICEKCLAELGDKIWEYLGGE